MARPTPLSRRFYNTFGDENTNELVGLLNAMDATHLDELRALNETNAARFESKLDQRIADVRAEFRTALADLRAHVDIEFRSVRAEMQVGFANVRGEMQVGFETVRTDGANLWAEMGALRADLTEALRQASDRTHRWVMGLTITTMLTVAGALFGVLTR